MKKAKNRSVTTRFAKAYGKILNAAEELDGLLKEYEQPLTNRAPPLAKQHKERGRSSSQNKWKPAPRVDVALDPARLQMVPYVSGVKSAQTVGAIQNSAALTKVSPSFYSYDEMVK